MRQIITNTIKKRGLLFLKLAIEKASLASFTTFEYQNDNAVYVVTSDYHKSISSYKIGMTTVGIDSRINSLKYYTEGKPRLVTWIYCDDDYREEPKILETVLHRIFLHGPGLGREWFWLFEWDLHWLEKLKVVNTKKLEQIIMDNDEEIIIQSTEIRLKGLINIGLLNEKERRIFDVGNLGESVIRNERMYFRSSFEL